MPGGGRGDVGGSDDDIYACCFFPLVLTPRRTRADTYVKLCVDNRKLCTFNILPLDGAKRSKSVQNNKN